MPFYSGQLVAEPYSTNDWNGNKEDEFFMAKDKMSAFTGLSSAEMYEVYDLFSDFMKELQFINEKLEDIHKDYLNVSSSIKRLDEQK